jgi:hypothetical protein
MENFREQNFSSVALAKCISISILLVKVEKNIGYVSLNAL